MSGTLSRSNIEEDDRTSYKVIPISPSSARFYEYTTPEHSLSAAINMSLNFHVNMGFKIYQSVLDYKSGKINLDITKKSIMKNVKISYYNLIVMQEKIKVSEESLTIKEKRYQQALINYRNGFKSEYDMLSAQVDYENAKPDLMNVKNEYSKALLVFKQIVGLKSDVELNLITKIESGKKNFNADELTAKYLKDNLELKLFRFNVESIRNAGFMAMGALTPTFTMGYSVSSAFKNDPNDKIWWSENSWSKYDSEYVKDNWSVANNYFYITLTLPISSFMPFGKEHVDILKNQFLLQSTRLQYKNKMENLEIEIKSLANNITNAKEKVDSYKRTLDLNERAYRKAEEAYAAGYKDLLDVQNQDNQRNTAKLNLLGAELSYINNVLELEYIFNTELK